MVWLYSQANIDKNPKHSATDENRKDWLATLNYAIDTGGVVSGRCEERLRASWGGCRVRGVDEWWVRKRHVIPFGNVTKNVMVELFLMVREKCRKPISPDWSKQKKSTRHLDVCPKFADAVLNEGTFSIIKPKKETKEAQQASCASKPHNSRNTHFQ